jgi:predicted HTH domain antitoxin
MKARLILDLDNPEQKKEHTRCLKSLDYMLALEEIQQEIFRPARKHLYREENINDLVLDRLSKAEKTELELRKMELQEFQQNLRDEKQKDYAKDLEERLSQVRLETTPTGVELIGLLEDKFYEILRERKIDFEDL